jgi:hypothetical protein
MNGAPHNRRMVAKMVSIVKVGTDRRVAAHAKTFVIPGLTRNPDPYSKSGYRLSPCGICKDSFDSTVLDNMDLRG